MSLIDTSGCSGDRCSVLKPACQAPPCTFPASSNSVCPPLHPPPPPHARPQPQSSAPPTLACFYGSRGTLYNDLSCPQFPYKLSLWFSFLPRGRVPLGTPLGSVGPSGPCSWYGGWQTAESARLPPSALRAAVGVRVRVRDTRYIRGLALRAGRPPAPHSPLLLRPPSLAWNLSSLNPGRAGLGDPH